MDNLFKGVPIVEKIKITSGRSDVETEVWIKGKRFSETGNI
jgi:hypothetical protein